MELISVAEEENTCNIPLEYTVYDRVRGEVIKQARNLFGKSLPSPKRFRNQDFITDIDNHHLPITIVHLVAWQKETLMPDLIGQAVRYFDRAAKDHAW